MHTASSSASSSSHVRVYETYSAEDGPPPVESGWTRFVCISDTHQQAFSVPPGDVLLHSGDLTDGGSLTGLRFTLDWLAGLPHPCKIVTAGNHDLCLDPTWDEVTWNEKAYDQAREMIEDDDLRKAGVRYLEYESTEVVTSSGQRWKVFGSPAAPVYSVGAFQYANRQEARDIYARIPDDTQILLTHTPPHGIQDRSRSGKHAGCHVLRRTLDERLAQCRLHVFGHIHEAHGADVQVRADKAGKGTGERETPRERVSVNAALGMVRSKRRPIVVDLRNDQGAA